LFFFSFFFFCEFLFVLSQKKQAAQGEALSGLVGEVLRGGG